MLLNEYPNADPSKFDFGYNMDALEKLKSIDIYYKSGPKYSDLIDIRGGKFKEDWIFRTA